MPAAKKATKRVAATTKGKKAIKTNLNRKSSDDRDGSYRDEIGSEGEASASSDTNEADLELFRAAFASVKSKNTKKKNAEFLKKNQVLVDDAREQAEAMKLAGLAHLEQLTQGFESISQPSIGDDLSEFAELVGDRSASGRELFETSKLSLEDLAADYEKAFQDAEDEVQKRAGRREKLRRRTVRHGYQILERGIEEQKLITDAANFVKNFQRLMAL
ncbi:hypothetical protein RSOLAG1IB_00974 [Rhizoctonia solani AG-1 IB]|uniref:Uncharacterized protein n=1 Tax=Thanatephorus cucumeris (strain AG1-IB / isolate 7/3/14) TaxID=1108050 RepID=A0A0B7F883_THACB|nr:hypothetical protein RSOLAG1IB_00974 [Rhizoctonia solani AG-1 IB]